MEKEKINTGIQLKPCILKEAEPWLNEYFGISYGYFDEEISRMDNYWSVKVEVGESLTLKALELDEWITFALSFTLDNFSQLFACIEEEDDSDELIMTVLLLVAYIVKVKDFSWIEDNQDFIDYAFYNIVREDLLKLYVFTNERKSDTLQGQKISIKHAKGSVEIANFENWFTQNLLKDYLANYLADIESVEQAEEELLTYKKRAGRKIKDNRMHIVLFGIFRMFNDQKKMKSPQSDSLCEFILSYLQFVGLVDDDTNIDNRWIRAQITYIKTKPEPPKMESRGVTYRASIEELKSSGKRLY